LISAGLGRAGGREKRGFQAGEPQQGTPGGLFALFLRKAATAERFNRTVEWFYPTVE
jgi:hypothetical protein